MNLTRMMTDKVFFENRNGVRIGPFKTKFGADRITVFQEELNVGAGDRVLQPMPDGTEQSYIAEAVNRHDARRNIPAHVSITIAKEGASQAAGTMHESAGAHAPVPGNENIFSLCRSLAELIENSHFPAEQKTEAMLLLRALVEHPVVAAVLAPVERM